MSNPRFPVYIVSKGRWESRLTAKALIKMNVPFSIVVEPQEEEQYREAIPEATVLVLPFRDRGVTAARNWVWDHALSRRADWFWILDDNIRSFQRYNRNRRIRVADGTIFYAAEDFCLRYENIAQAGFQYFTFCIRRRPMPPYYFNTRIYSCTFIRADLPFRWRAVYNEDTDLSLQMLKAGWCTVLFNAFLAEKQATMTMKGGNTEELYLIEEGRLKMAKALQALHPDCVKISWKWNRWQHSVDYSAFQKNRRLRRKADVAIPEGVNNFGMVLQERGADGVWREIPEPPNGLPSSRMDVAGANEDDEDEEDTQEEDE